MQKKLFKQVNTRTLPDRPSFEINIATQQKHSRYILRDQGDVIEKVLFHFSAPFFLI